MYDRVFKAICTLLLYRQSSQHCSGVVVSVTYLNQIIILHILLHIYQKTKLNFRIFCIKIKTQIDIVLICVK